MLGYKEVDLLRFISNLMEIEGTKDEIKKLEEVADFLEGLLAEGFFDE